MHSDSVLILVLYRLLTYLTDKWLEWKSAMTELHITGRDDNAESKEPEKDSVRRHKTYEEKQSC